MLAAVTTVSIEIPGYAAAVKCDTEYAVKLSDVKLNESGLQKNLTFPDCMNYVDDTLIINNMYTFKGYAGQGKLYITCSNGLTSVNVFINGVAINVSQACRNNGKCYEINYSKIARDGNNTIQVTNFLPETGKVNVKIPYLTVVSGAASSRGFDQQKLNVIDTMIDNDIKYGYASGQLCIIKDGVMVKNTAYGKLNSYNPDGTRKTDSPNATVNTLYDLASNTKMYATNYALQKLVYEGKIAITDKVTKYFPDFADSEDDKFKGKADITLEDVLEHQAGFPADPQYHNDKYNQDTQKYDPNGTNSLFSQDKQTTLKMIMKTPLQYEPGTKTVYSDVDYMLLGFVVENVTGMPLDCYVESNIYQPLGLNRIVYNPLQKGFTKNDCAATELHGNTRDGAISFKNARTYTLQGEVQDAKAYYSMAGVSGHAGLFASARDLAKLCQVMLNGGGYDNTKLFDKTVIDNFTKPKFKDSTYGLGWRREGDNGYRYYFGVQSSTGTIGHTGWTGTLTVIDPDKDLVIVWLTNKKNSPVADNKNNPNEFGGDEFVSATGGSIATMVYDALENGNLAATDANLSQMIVEKAKLIQAEKDVKVRAWLVKSEYSLIDTLVTRAEASRSKTTVRYAAAAVAGLDSKRDPSVISQFNQRIAKIKTDRA